MLYALPLTDLMMV